MTKQWKNKSLTEIEWIQRMIAILVVYIDAFKKLVIQFNVENHALIYAIKLVPINIINK